MNVEKKECIMY